MLASYEAGFAAEWGRKAREIVTEHGQQYFGIRVKENVAAREHWEIEKAYRTQSGWDWRTMDGGMHTAGIMGSLTGRGGDIVIIDDPVKNAQEAFSTTIRENIWDWFDSTLMTRLEPNAAVIVIMTRWHEDDLVGRLLQRMEAGGEQWSVFNLPAIAEENDPAGRQPGEALWPERYPIERLEEIRRDRGEYWFSAMYQQRPIPIGKALFSRATTKRYIIEGGIVGLIQEDGSKLHYSMENLLRFSTVDLAASVKTTADFTCVSTWGMTPRREIILLDVQKLRLEGPDQLPLLQNIWLSFRPAAFYIESTSYQLSMVQSAVRAGLPVFPIHPDTDKVARALTASARFHAGMYYFPLAAPWLADAEKELYSFPAGDHDDFVDTVSMSALVGIGDAYTGNLG
jgi:predicted phage terminase large subunit-like protein